MKGQSRQRVLAMVVKEFWAVLRDPRGRITLFAPPVLQLFLFGFAATLEIKNVDLGVLDQDRGAYSQELINRLAASPNVRTVTPLASSAAVETAIDEQRVIAVLAVDERFSRDLAAGRNATVQVIYDGRRSTAAQIVNSYIAQIVADMIADLKPGVRVAGASIVDNWFNPNLDYIWFTLPSLVVTIAALSALSITGQSIAREKELGTFDQLLVSPLRPWEILVGKIAPALLVGIVNATLYLILIPLVFHVPFRGSIALFYLSLLLYLTALIGLGIFISILSRTQQQAFLGIFLAVIPLILLSGFTSPIENMPPWLQIVAQADPLSHFLYIVEGLFLKGVGPAAVFAHLWPLVLLAALSLTASAAFFRARME